MRKKKKLVVKIGSSTLTTSDSSIDESYLKSLAGQVAQLRSEGFDVVIVSSAAIACGLEALGIRKRPSDMPSLQAAASVGQCALSASYAEAFAEYGIVTSLVLLTRRDTADREAYLHARDTLERLIQLNVVPIVNENDTVSVEQIRFGDNDTLAALVACLINADGLVIVSDIDGLYDRNPRESDDARLMSTVNAIDQAILSCAGGAGSSAGSGGMITKLRAARVLMAAGIEMAIVNGGVADSICKSVHGDAIGTRFVPQGIPHEITPKKLWIALGDSPRGAVVVDSGAKDALTERGSSLLVVGVKQVAGSFDADDIVDVKDEDGLIIGRGKVSCSSDETMLAIGMDRDELLSNRLLSHMANTALIHRDEFIVF